MQDNLPDDRAAEVTAEFDFDLERGHVADIVEHLNEQETEDVADVVAGLTDERAVGLLDQPEFEDAAEVVAAMPPERAAALLSGVSADRATDILGEMEEPQRSRL
ncbi:MAG: magnesium transporter, partial [Rhizobiales bacterium]|nr:magnesium transporter [Hyphomicrobiales bacterium]